MPSTSLDPLDECNPTRPSSASAISVVQTDGAWCASSQSASSRRSSGGFDRIGRSGASRRFQRPGSSTTTMRQVRAVGAGVVPGTARLPASRTHCAMSSTELQTAGAPPRRMCGSHFAQSHMAARSGLLRMTRSRSAGPCSVTASTMSVRASAERTRSDPAIAIARSLPRSTLVIDGRRRIDANPERQHERIGMVGSALPQRRRRVHGVAEGVDDRPSVRCRTAPGWTAERNGAVAVRSRQRPRRRSVRGDRRAERRGIRRSACRSPHGVGEVTGAPSSATSVPSATTVTSDEPAADGSTTISNVACSTGARSSSSALERRPGPNAVAARPESHDVGRRPARRPGPPRCRRPNGAPGAVVRSSTTAPATNPDVVERRRRVDRAAVDQRQLRNRLAGDRREYVTQRGGGCVRDDRHVGITMGSAHDDVHRPEHYGTGRVDGDVSRGCSTKS